MGHRGRTEQRHKISAEFARRLERLGPRDKVRAILLLGNESEETSSLERRSAAGRAATIEVVRETAQRILPDIDPVLRRYHGRRLADTVDGLGSMPIEITPAGISALAALKHIKTILEDQPITSVPIRR